MTLTRLGSAGAHTQSLGSAVRDRTPPAEGTAAVTRSIDAPPRGTDPELWKVLSRSERERFAKIGAGPLTYGYLIHSGRLDLPVFRGHRVDIKA